MRDDERFRRVSHINGLKFRFMTFSFYNTHLARVWEDLKKTLDSDISVQSFDNLVADVSRELTAIEAQHRADQQAVNTTTAAVITDAVKRAMLAVPKEPPKKLYHPGCICSFCHLEVDALLKQFVEMYPVMKSWTVAQIIGTREWDSFVLGYSAAQKCYFTGVDDVH